MSKLTSNSLLVLAYLLIVGWGVPESAYCADTIVDSLYHQAREAGESGNWNAVDRLSGEALQRIDAVEGKNWTYTGTRKPQEAVFFGNYVILLVLDEETSRFLIEIWDPAKDELLRKHDEEPWEFTPFDAPTFYSTENYVYLKLERKGSLGYQLMCFRKGVIEPEQRILREGIQESILTGMQVRDQITLLEKGNGGIFLTSIDLSSGTVHPILKLTQSDRNQRLERYPYKLYEENGIWRLIADNQIWTINRQNFSAYQSGELPIQIRPEDDSWEGIISAVRNDSIYVIRTREGKPVKVNVIHLKTNEGDDGGYRQPVQISDDGNWLAYNSSDSLLIYRIIEDSARMAYRSGSSGKFLRWFSDYLVNSGEKGIQVIRGGKLLYDVKGVAVKSILYNDILYMHSAPDSFSALDLRSGKTLWTRKINLPSYYVNFGLINYSYIYLNHDNGLSFLDMQTGNDLLRVNTLTEVKPVLNESNRQALIVGQNFVSIMQIAPFLRLKSDLFALQAAARWAQKDTTTAISAGRKALLTGFDLSSPMMNYIYKIFNDLEQKREVVRIMGRAVLETNDPTWRGKLSSAGLDLITDNILYDFGGYNIYVSQAGVFAFQQITGSEYFHQTNPEKCYTFDRPQYSGSRLMRSFTYASEFEGGIVFYEYSAAPDNHLEYRANLLDQFGHWTDLGVLIKSNPTPPVLDIYPHFPNEYLLSQPLNGRALVNYPYKLRLRKEYPIACSIDLNGSGHCWIDTTLVDPVYVRERCYAHQKYGDLILKTGSGSQARRIGLQEGDIVLSLGGVLLSNTLDVPQVIERSPLGTAMDMRVKRDADTLNFAVVNGPIGYLPASCYNLVEINPDNGERLDEIGLPKGYHIVGCNGFGQLVYQLEDTLFFLDPTSKSQKKLIIRDLKDYRKWYRQQKDDVLIYRKERSDTKLAIDISGAVDDSARLLWKQALSGDILSTDDNETIPLLQEGGTLIIVERTSGAVLARETLPFKSIESAQVKSKNLYGIASGRLFSWRIAFYHPPFPWQSMGYGAAALAPLLLATWPIYRRRINLLKKRQVAEIQRTEMETELNAARKLQANMIPTGSRILGNYQIVGKFQPASHVGGDYFDYRLMEDGRLMVVIGDVSGHGLPAGILVSMAKASLITVLRQKHVDFNDTLAALNEVIRKGSTEKRMFMTLCYLILDPKRGLIGCSANGHPYPLIAHRDGSVDEVEASGGYPLGISDKQKFSLIEAAFSPGETLLLYTDGLPEQVNDLNEPWGYENLQVALGKSAGEFELELAAQSMVEKALRHAGKAPQADDMTVVVIRYNELSQNF
jgi:serine phosphatase RsbU (regulator of sigma subunit)